MKTAGVVLLLLSLGLSTVLAENVTCLKCDGHNTDYCEGEEHKCPDDNLCMTISESIGVDPNSKPVRSIRRRCSNNLPCTGDWYAYYNDTIFFQISPKCCKGNLCNNGTFQEMNKTAEKLGPKCPACYSTDTSKMCTPTSVTICRGETDQCATIRARIKTADGVEHGLTAQGCMSELACQYPDYSYVVGLNIYNLLEHVCYLPKPEPQNGTESKATD
ncbi:phospholipase A2 inhibitor and Ly6/PLAUR domain-containing protein-like isoform X2 [Rana temporaria]|uniref:phospholipase A2 inhibitor and Ly6/PLAUR domain-containing protein-like isoform X2 n=1 Tax=Rana temporaria TaxID=8407 RepID=UPI001AAD1A9E|nr:phospholipase A2 inhibitor and Ly6/PLAUR domain-containing protein-like isoform X2 [Rana temporaria]